MLAQNDTSATAQSLASAISEGSAQAVASSLADAYALGGASAEATSAAIAQAYSENPGKIRKPPTPSAESSCMDLLICCKPWVQELKGEMSFKQGNWIKKRGCRKDT
eukprot:1155345-Pelagomonas_calceolata.AAC.2